MTSCMDSVLSSLDVHAAAASATTAALAKRPRRESAPAAGADVSDVNADDYAALTCSHDGCGAAVRDAGWICDCHHVLCEAHAPQRGPVNLSGEVSRVCPVCGHSLSSDQLHRFDSGEVRASGRFALVGASCTQAFAALEFVIQLWLRQCGADLKARARRLEAHGATEEALTCAETEKARLTTRLDELQATVVEMRDGNRRAVKAIKESGLEMHGLVSSVQTHGKAIEATERCLAETRAKEAEAERLLESRQRENHRLREALRAAGHRYSQRSRDVNVNGSVVGDGKVGDRLSSHVPFESTTPSTYSGAAGGGGRGGVGFGFRGVRSGIGDGESTVGPSISAVNVPAGCFESPSDDDDEY